MRRAVFRRAPRAVVRLRAAATGDLEGVNALIERAVAGWRLPERVKRLVLPTYFYRDHDLAHLQLVLACDAVGNVLGVAAWEPAMKREAPAGGRALLLHGLYVDPAQQRRGVGAQLLAAALDAARADGYDGLLAKAQQDAVGFFEACGLQRLPVTDSNKDYPYRYWQPTRV